VVGANWAGIVSAAATIFAQIAVRDRSRPDADATLLTKDEVIREHCPLATW
jgi:hypothetical protein